MKNKVIFDYKDALKYARHILRTYHVGNYDELQVIEELDNLLKPTKNKKWETNWEKDDDKKYTGINSLSEIEIIQL